MAYYQDVEDNDKRNKVISKAYGRWTMLVFLKNSDKHKYGGLMKPLKQKYGLGLD